MSCIRGPVVKTVFQWLLDLHAPTGRWAPFAAAGCFAATNFTHVILLRWLLQGVAGVLVVLIAADLARALMERQPPISVGGIPIPTRNLPINAFQLALTGAAAVLYTVLIFIGIVPISPRAAFVLLPVIVVVAWLAAWRNVRLWYTEGAEYEDELNALAHEQEVKDELKTMRIARSQWDRQPPFP